MFNTIVWIYIGERHLEEWRPNLFINIIYSELMLTFEYNQKAYNPVHS